MIVNEEGHIVMTDGQTTEVPSHELERFYVGNRLNFITFRHMALGDGRYVVHSQLHDVEGLLEDFLYEVVDQGEAYGCAVTMVEDAEDYLESAGVTLDDNGTPTDFLDRLREELKSRLH
jgi:hypothetical protein